MFAYDDLINFLRVMCINIPFTTERLIKVGMAKNHEWPAIKAAISKMERNKDIKEISKDGKSKTYILLSK